LLHGEKWPNPSKPTGRASTRPSRPGQGPPQRSGEEDGGAERSRQEKSRRREKEREKGSGGWGRDRGKRITAGGGLNTTVKKKHCRYYRLQGPVPPASQRTRLGVLRDLGLPVLPGFGRYHRLEPVPPGLGAGTTGRAGKQRLR